MARFKPLVFGIVSAVCCVSISLLLLGCDDSPAASSAPTPQPSPVHGLITYTGRGFSIGFPQGWYRPTSATSTVVVFSGPSLGVPTLRITTAPNPNGRLSADMLATSAFHGVEASLLAPHLVSAPSTVTVGGDHWLQKVVAGSASVNGTSAPLQIVVLADNHPAHSRNTMSFIIIYEMTLSQFAATDTSTFQPMLHSFTFTP